MRTALSRLARAGLFSVALWLSAGCEGQADTGECQDGDSRCQGLTKIQYCLNTNWMAATTCPPDQVNGFSITTICDNGECHP